jgi:hypothetical protein
MANEQYAFIEKAKLPDLTTWQAAIDDAGFDLQLDPELKIGSDVGFASCTLHGADAGVEIYFEDSEEFLSQFADIAPNKDYCISFRWGGSEIECACAMILSYALAKRCDAIISYEGDTPYDSLDALLADTNGMLKDAGIQ